MTPREEIFAGCFAIIATYVVAFVVVRFILRLVVADPAWILAASLTIACVPTLMLEQLLGKQGKGK